MERRARVIALYLPQFHPIPENDLWWGKGFTEWTNTAKAKPLFFGHRQPNLPAGLGFYDLRVPDVREEQARLAQCYGVEAFCYYYYWFNGKRLLERPLDDMIRSGVPDFPFCLCWANGSWTGIWHGAANRILQEQTYPGREDDERHFHEVLLPALSDRRYLKIDGKPLVAVHAPQELPHGRALTDTWRRLALAAGIGELHLLGFGPQGYWRPAEQGFDSGCSANLPGLRPWVPWSRPVRKLRFKVQHWLRRPTIYRYREESLRLLDAQLHADFFPVVIPNWDNTPRSGRKGRVLHGAHPDLFGAMMRAAIAKVAHRTPGQRLIILKSWNEWAEGNYVEPDLEFGHGWLEAIADAVLKDG